MASNILSVSTTSANSADVVVTANTPLTVALKGNTTPTVLAPNSMALYASVEIRLKDDAGLYWTYDTLHTKNKPVLLLDKPGTYQFFRSANSQPVGVFSG